MAPLNANSRTLARKRLTRHIQRLWRQNKTITPKVLLGGMIQVAPPRERAIKALIGISLILVGLMLFARVDWTMLLAIVFFPVGVLLVRDAWKGKKKTVRDYLRDLSDEADRAQAEVEIEELVNNVFEKMKNKLQNLEAAGTERRADLELPDCPDISIGIDVADIPDITTGTGDIVTGILEGIFSGL